MNIIQVGTVDRVCGDRTVSPATTFCLMRKSLIGLDRLKTGLVNGESFTKCPVVNDSRKKMFRCNRSHKLILNACNMCSIKHLVSVD